MENKRNFKDKEEYGYINIPNCCDIYNITTKTAIFDAWNDNTKALFGMWCFSLEESSLYKNILDALKQFIVAEYPYSDSCVDSMNYWITLPSQNRILEIHPTFGIATTKSPYNAFPTIEDAEAFLRKIKLFLNLQGINLGNWH